MHRRVQCVQAYPQRPLARNPVASYGGLARNGLWVERPKALECIKLFYSDPAKQRLRLNWVYATMYYLVADRHHKTI